MVFRLLVPRIHTKAHTIQALDVPAEDLEEFYSF
jgi:hypothetical protein